jgi:cellulose synthase/poly-beta-1,6-N-acetylglucosamine synthase-like glycosyltransferase
MLISQLILWTSALALIHSYFIYPFLLKILASRKKSNSIIFSREEKLPSISILIPAYNEEQVIEEKIQNIFNSDYPSDRLEVLVGSDSSTDKTNEIVRNYEKRHKNLHLVEFKSRSGKPKIINQLSAQTNNEILVLTDANIMLHADALFEMCKHFKNENIALVDTNMQHKGLKKEGISRQEKTYIQGEVAIKNAEGKIWGGMIGPFGGCYAIRKNYYTEVPENSLVDDFYISMKVLEKGGQAINEINASVYEDASSVLREEFRRKIRIAGGNFQNLFRFLHLLFRFDHISFCFLSHKVLRWLGPLFILLAYLSNCLIVFNIVKQYGYEYVFGIKEFYITTFLLQNLLFFMPVLDFSLNKLGFHPLIPRLISHFLSMNLALLIGFFRFLSGIKSGVWVPTQRNQNNVIM